MIILSLGAGVQSSTLLLMAASGAFDVVPDCAVFADTQAEPKAVYDWLEFLEKEVGNKIPVVRTTVGNLESDTLNGRLPSSRQPSVQFVTIPLMATTGTGKSMLRRQCTQEYKLRPIYKWMREQGMKKVDMWIGITTDEAHRMKPARVQWVSNCYPLIDRRMTRHDCLLWLERHGYPRPPRSACVFCPFHNNAEWRDMKTNDPDSWDRAVQFDNHIRNLPWIEGRSYLHQSMKPLSEVDFRTAEDFGQVNLFGQECEGMCGV